MKKLLFTTVLVIVAAFFTACGGAGSPSSVENSGSTSSEEGGGGSSSSEEGGGGSSSSEEGGEVVQRVGPIKTTSDSPWVSFNFELFGVRDCEFNLGASNAYIIPRGSWKATYINTEEENIIENHYYEFESPAEDNGSLSITKQVIVIRHTKTDEEIAAMENMEPSTFNSEYLAESDNATSYDYYLDGNDFVTIYVYEGDDVANDNVRISKSITWHLWSSGNKNGSGSQFYYMPDFQENYEIFYFQKR
ncbi:MAG: hypothetical protein J6Y69_02010 [Treponema sp.]|nr:hypothetical protein [Treponema sp.]